MSLVELLISLGIFSIVLSVFFGVLFSVQQGVARSADRSVTNDNARVALQQIDREVRSGNVFYDPDDEPDPDLKGLGLRVYTQTNVPSRGGHRCIEWRISAGELQSRSWATDWDTNNDSVADAAEDVVGWRTIATGLQNTAATPAFSRPNPSTLIVDLRVQENSRSGGVASLRTSLTGRNTQYGYPTTPCDNIPPAGAP